MILMLLHCALLPRKHQCSGDDVDLYSVILDSLHYLKEEVEEASAIETEGYLGDTEVNQPENDVAAVESYENEKCVDEHHELVCPELVVCALDLAISHHEQYLNAKEKDLSSGNSKLNFTDLSANGMIDGELACINNCDQDHRSCDIPKFRTLDRFRYCKEDESIKETTVDDISGEKSEKNKANFSHQIERQGFVGRTKIEARSKIKESSKVLNSFQDSQNLTTDSCFSSKHKRKRSKRKRKQKNANPASSTTGAEKISNKDSSGLLSTGNVVKTCKNILGESSVTENYNLIPLNEEPLSDSAHNERENSHHPYSKNVCLSESVCDHSSTTIHNDYKTTSSFNRNGKNKKIKCENTAGVKRKKHLNCGCNKIPALELN
ncbi:hypothetical protein Anas_11354, partial [Armadillidium nasatum]